MKKYILNCIHFRIGLQARTNPGPPLVFGFQTGLLEISTELRWV